MSRRIKPLGLFLLMLWLPPAFLVGLRLAGCSPLAADQERPVVHASAKEAEYSAADAEGVSF